MNLKTHNEKIEAQAVENKQIKETLAELKRIMQPSAEALPAHPKPEEEDQSELISPDINHSSASLYRRPPEPDQGGGNAPSLSTASFSPGSHSC